MHSVFGGRPVWFDTCQGVADVVAPGYTYNETQAGFTYARGPSNTTLSMLGVNAVGSYADGQAFRVEGNSGTPNMELLLKWVVESTTENLPGIWLRGGGAFGGAVQSRDATCYWFEADSDSFAINLVTSIAGTGALVSGSTTTVAWTVGASAYLRAAAVGNLFLAKAWAATDPEPGWQMRIVDSAVTDTSTRYGFGLNGGASGISDYSGLMQGFWAWSLDAPIGAIAR